VIAVLILWGVAVLTLATMGVIATAAGWQGAPLTFSYAALAIGSVGVVLALILVLVKRR
jgi:TRAP-type C4-dicarboxylate transport system permease small subunit